MCKDMYVYLNYILFLLFCARAHARVHVCMHAMLWFMCTGEDSLQTLLCPAAKWILGIDLRFSGSVLSCLTGPRLIYF